MANIFLSYRGVDVSEAEKLAKELKQNSHQVWFDHWEITLGDSIIEQMDSGLAGANYLILCYSSSGWAPWINREWLSALARQLNGHNIKILPVLLTGGKPPAILADIKYADLKKDWTEGVKQLLLAIK